MIRGIIFDLGNTLMYLDDDWGAATRRGTENMCAYLNERGYTLPESFATSFIETLDGNRPRAARANIEYTAADALNDTLAMHSICWIPDTVIPRAVEKLFEPEIARWLVYPDARATLESLRGRGLKLALLSNATDHAFIERIARSGNLAEFFDPLLSSAKISHRKPDPRAFQPILNAWQLPAREIVMVGDAPSFDILGAHRTGMRGVLIEGRWDNPFPPHDDFSDAALMKPDAVIHQLSELPRVLDTFEQEERVHA